LSIYHCSAAISLNAGLFILENTTPPAYYTWGKKEKRGKRKYGGKEKGGKERMRTGEGKI
jgi:hypothetical protein